MPFLSGFPGVFLFSRVDCPPRRAAADVRPPAAPGHKKRRRPPSTPSRSMNVRMCGPFPPEICPFPLKNGGFPTLPPVLPVYPGFSIILSPYTLCGAVFPARRVACDPRALSCTFFDPSVHLPLSVLRNSLDGAHRPHALDTAASAMRGGGVTFRIAERHTAAHRL